MPASSTDAVPRLVVVVPTVRGWGADLAAWCAAIAPQLASTGAQALVVDGSGRPPPPGDDLPSGLAWLTLSASNVAALRDQALAAGVQRAGPDGIVAITEDHCRIAPDWCEAILRAHREHPEADAINGAVDNDSRERALDWASFLAEHAPELAPLPVGPVDRLAGIDVSFKARAVGSPRRILQDDRIRVWHRQSYGTCGTARMHFHSGRTAAGRARPAGMGPRLGRAARALALPLPRAARRLVTARSRGQPIARLVAVAPWLVGLLWVQSIGEALGSMAGPGRSPEQVH